MTATAAPPVRRTPAYRAVLAAFASLGLAAGTWGARIPDIKAGLALDEGSLGTTLLGLSIGAVVGALGGGVVVRRVGSRRSVRVGWVLVGLLLVLPGQASSWAGLTAAFAALGLAVGLLDVSMNGAGVQLEHAAGVPLLSGLHAGWSAGVLAGAAAGSLAVAAGVSTAVHLTVVGGVALAAGLALGRDVPDGVIAPGGDDDGDDATGAMATGAAAAGADAAGASAAGARRIGPGPRLAALAAIGGCVFLAEGALLTNVDHAFAQDRDRDSPADRLTLDVPRDLAAAGQLQVSLKDQALSLVDAASQTEQEDALNRMHKSVVLPSACIGPCELIVRYAVELPASATDAGAVTEVPLVVPVDATVTTNSLLLTASENIRLQHRDEHWRLWEGDQAQAPRSQGLRLSAVEPTRSVAFAVQFDDGGKSGSTVVRRAWVQTWLTGASRQDRAVFRFYSTQAQLQIVLPAGVNPEDVEVFLDGDRAVGRPTPYGQLIVPLTPAADPESRQLELSYHFRAVRQGPGSLALELPRLGEDVWTRRVYWELVLPGTEHVIASPGGLTPEFRWDWMGAFWSREPSLDQTALENWVGVQPSAPLPSGANCYLFSSPGIPTRCEIRTATRSLLVLSASGTALVLGLLLIYVPAVRHPVVLLAMVFALAGAAMVYPGPALLAAQAACLGVILTLVACLLQQALRRKRPRATALDRGSSVFFEKGSTQVHHRASPLADHAAPEAAPEAIQVPVSDSHA